MRVVIVPGAAVRRYVEPAARALQERGVDTRLLAAPGEPDTPADLWAYGEQLGQRLVDGPPVDLLIGLSVGAQAAAVAAAAAPPSQLRRLMRPALLREQAPDWRRAGPRRLAALVRSALDLRIEDVLPDVAAALTVVHGENDVITSHAYAARLAADHSGTLLVVPRATHSWPYADADRFADTIQDVIR